MSTPINPAVIVEKMKQLWRPEEIYLNRDQLELFRKQEKIAPNTRLDVLIKKWEERLDAYRDAYVNAYVQIGVKGLQLAMVTEEDHAQYSTAEQNLLALPGVNFESEHACVSAAFSIATEAYHRSSKAPLYAATVAAITGSLLGVGTWAKLPKKEMPAEPTQNWQDKTLVKDDSSRGR